MRAGLRVVMAVAALVAAVVVAAAPAAAQSRGGASLRITVLDETAAVLPGAAVLLVGDDGVEHTLQVDDTGVVTATDLTPGTYTLGASFPGFRPASGAICAQTKFSAEGGAARRVRSTRSGSTAPSNSGCAPG